MNWYYSHRTTETGRMSLASATLISVLAMSATASVHADNSEDEDKAPESLVPQGDGPISLSATYVAESDISDNDVDVSKRQSDIRLKLPFGAIGDSSDGGLVAFGFSYRQRSIDLETPIGEITQSLYDIAFPITYVNKPDENTTLVLNLAPGLKSSLERVEEDDFAATAFAQLYTKGQVHSYSWGGLVTHAFGTRQLLPAGSYTYTPDVHWNVTLGFPVTHVSYAPEHGQHYFLRLSPDGGQWHTYSSADSDDSFQYSQRSFRFGGGGQWKITGPLWLELESGIQFGQTLKVEADDVVDIDESFDNAWYVKLGLNLRLGG